VTNALIGAAGLILAAMVTAVGLNVQRVHKIVNSQRDEMIARIDQLIALLESSGIVVPTKRDPLP
jgi:hypothetical protein